LTSDDAEVKIPNFLTRGTMDYFICVIGMVMIVEGLPYFAFPDRMKVWVQKVLEMPDTSLRRFGLVLMVLGMWLVYMGRN
jgi:uncharacterized protein